MLICRPVPDGPAVGDRLLTTGDITPIPLRLAVCGLPVALSVTLNVPVLEPVAVGVKVTWIEQLVLAAKVAGQLLV